MKQYLITGLCKREYRGKGRDTTLQTTIEADNKKEAGVIFEKNNPAYSAASVAELPKTKPEHPQDDSDTDDGMDIASEHDEDD